MALMPFRTQRREDDAQRKGTGRWQKFVGKEPGVRHKFLGSKRIKKFQLPFGL